MDNEELEAEAREFFDTEYPKCNSNGWLVMARFAAKKLAEAGQSADWVATADRLPDAPRKVWVTFSVEDWVHNGVGQGRLFDGKWEELRYGSAATHPYWQPLCEGYTVIAWMEIAPEPQPYKQEKTK